MSDATDHVQISARIPADLAEALERAAEREDRTFSAELRQAIRRYLAEEAPDLKRAA
jgi:predicted transcriptional regulator